MKPADFLRRLAAGWPGDSLLPALLGVGATLGFAPWGWYGLTLLAPAGLLWLWDGVTPRRAAGRGFVFGLAHFSLGIYWVSISIHRFGGGPLWLAWLLVLALAVYLAVFPALIGYVLRRWFQHSAAVQALVVLPLLWLFVEVLRGWLFTGLPWLGLGYAFIDTPLSRLAPLAGVYVLGIVVVLLSGAIWLALVGTRHERLVALAAALTVSLVLSLLPVPAHWTQDSGTSVDVSLVQGNIPQELKWRPGRREMTQAHY
ncbi:MAG: hypothetical protein ACRESV_04105, partial [Nevskiales bacterium]